MQKSRGIKFDYFVEISKNPPLLVKNIRKSILKYKKSDKERLRMVFAFCLVCILGLIDDKV